MFETLKFGRPWQASVCMAVIAAALETYDSLTLREDLSDAENMISPTETPFISMLAGRGTATKTLHEWPLLELAAIYCIN